MDTPTKLPQQDSGSAWPLRCSLLLAATITALFWALNHFQPLSADDYAYAFIWGTSERVTCLADILTSQCAHWLEWSGRFVAHCLAQYFLMQDKLLFDVANTLVLLAVCAGITQLVVGKEQPGKWVAFSLILSLFVLLVPATGATLIWLDGSCNYLWSALLVVVLLCLALSSSRACRLLALLVAPLAGNSQEGISIALVCFLACRALLEMFHQRRFSPLLWATLVLTAAGLALNLMAPGTLAKMATVDTITSGGQSSTAGLLLAALSWTLKSLAVEHVYAEASLYPVLLMQLFTLTQLLRRRRLGLDQRNSLALCLLAATFVQACAILYSGALGSRPWIGVFLFSFLAALIYLIPMVQRLASSRQTWLVLAVGSAPVFLMLRALPPAHADREHVRYVEQQLRDGQQLIVKPGSWSGTLTTRRYRAGVCFYPNCFDNAHAARYYGARPFSFISEETKRKLALIPDHELRLATQGYPVMLPNGELLLSLPPDVQAATLSPDARSGRGQDPALVWPLPTGYLLLQPLAADARELHLRLTFSDKRQHDLRFTQAQLLQLRRAGALPLPLFPLNTTP